jgi:hypothetical protein
MDIMNLNVVHASGLIKLCIIYKIPWSIIYLALVESIVIKKIDLSISYSPIYIIEHCFFFFELFFFFFFFFSLRSII